MFSKTSLLRIRGNFPLKAAFNSLPLCLPKHFSTAADEDSSSSSSIDSFFQSAGSGMVYGKLVGITKHTMKTDIIHLLEGCNLTPEDIKPIYISYNPVAMMIQFHSRQAFDNAIKDITRKGRLYRLEKADRSQWDPIMSYDGKTVLLQGIPRNALVEDVERFLSDCEFDGSSIRLFMRQGLQDRTALVRFHTRTAAMNAFITKNRGFCLNNQISMQVLH